MIEECFSEIMLLGDFFKKSMSNIGVTLSDASFRRIMLAAVWSTHLIMESHGGRRQLG